MTEATNEAAPSYAGGPTDVPLLDAAELRSRSFAAIVAGRAKAS